MEHLPRALEKKRLHKNFCALFFVIGFLLTASPVFAGCCVCHTAEKPAEKICIAQPSDGACRDLPSSSKNQAVHSLSCTFTYFDANCALTNKGGVCQQGLMTDMSYSPAVAVAPTQAAAPTGPVSTPLKLGIPIPGVSFDQSLQQANGYTAAPFIAQYVAGIERYLISIAVIAAGIMLVVGGFFYTSSTAKGIDTGKAIIRDALIGLVLLLSCVLILETINPNTSNLTPARLYNSTRPPSKSAPKPPAKSVPAK